MFRKLFEDLDSDHKTAVIIVSVIVFGLLSLVTVVRTTSFMYPDPPPLPMMEKSRLAEQFKALSNACYRLNDEAKKEVILQLIEKYDPEHDSLNPNQAVDNNELLKVLKQSGLDVNDGEVIKKLKSVGVETDSNGF